MSGRSSRRRPGDRYLTPTWATSALLRAVPELRGDLLIDPCAADGRMAHQVDVRFFGALLNDIDPEAPTPHHLDATLPATWHGWRAFKGMRSAWVVTNPPFGCAGEIAWAALAAGFNLALLLRITFLEPTQGRAWLIRRPPQRLIVLPRIDFVGAGSTDSATCAWMLWGPVQPGVQIVRADSGHQLDLLCSSEPQSASLGECL